MINIVDKSKCCGCNACVQRCPKQCITMYEDEEGFLYPQVDIINCIDCGLCEKVCPILNQNKPKRPLKVFAVKNNNEDQRLRSSSGGVFILLAEQIIKQGGVVFGARFDKNWEVEHCYAETLEDLEPLMRSKYVQSRIGNTYKETEQFLKQGRQVLFVGTSCQIAGLKRFICKEYKNLLVVDIVCHGVPSPGVWRQYLSNECKVNKIDKVVVSNINFREKRGFGWKGYGFSLSAYCDNNVLNLAIPSWKNTFMIGFLENVYLRPSCSMCPAKAGKSLSDITLGDFWGIEFIMPEMDDNKGTSIVLVHTNKGTEFLNTLSVIQKAIDYATIIRYNPCIVKSTIRHPNRKNFFKLYTKDSRKTLREMLDEVLKLTIGQRIIRKIKIELTKRRTK